jgi:hypothetical protein
VVFDAVVFDVMLRFCVGEQPREQPAIRTQ